jgi:hypothetical protein
MQQNIGKQSVLRFLIVFFLISLGLLALKISKIAPAVDYTALFLGNLILFTATLLSYSLYKRTLRNGSMQAFLRAMYGSLFLKMMICILAILIYVWIARSNVSRIAIFGCFGFYFIYTFMEVKILMRMSKQKNA